MSKRLTKDDKLVMMKNMYKSFSKEQVEYLERKENVDARYKCAQRYMREINEGKKGERLKALEYYKQYREILEGLECVDKKLWTDEKKIKAFSNLLDGYCDKCVKLVEDNNRRRLEHLKGQLAQRKKEYESEQKKLEDEIKRLENEIK